MRTAWAFTLWGDPTLKLPRPADAGRTRCRTFAMRRPAIRSPSRCRTEPHEKVKSAKYQVEMLPNARLAGLLRKEKDDDGQPLVPFVFAEVQLPKAQAGCEPMLHSKMASSRWVFVLRRAAQHGLYSGHLAQDRREGDALPRRMAADGVRATARRCRRRREADNRSLVAADSGPQPQPARASETFRTALASHCGLRIVETHSGTREAIAHVTDDSLPGLTAAGLAILSLAFMATRYTVMGSEVQLPVGPNNWKVTMKVQGTFDGERRRSRPRRRWTSAASTSCAKATTAINCSTARSRHATPNAGKCSGRGAAAKKTANSSLTANITSTIETPHPPAGDGAPGEQPLRRAKPGAHLDPEKGTSAENERISSLAAQLSEGRENKADIAQVLYRYVAFQIKNEPTHRRPSGARRRLPQGRARRLRRQEPAARRSAAQPRHPGPHRHRPDADQGATNSAPITGSKRWVNDHWMGMCPFYDHFGKVPSTYVVFGFGDMPRGARPAHQRSRLCRFSSSIVPAMTRRPRPRRRRCTAFSRRFRCTWWRRRINGSSSSCCCCRSRRSSSACIAISSA